jgi:hypothetical protein
MKANHTAQDNEAVSFRVNDVGKELRLEWSINANGFMAVMAVMAAIQAAIPYVGSFANMGCISYPCYE